MPPHPLPPQPKTSSLPWGLFPLSTLFSLLCELFYLSHRLELSELHTEALPSPSYLPHSPLPTSLPTLVFPRGRLFLPQGLCICCPHPRLDVHVLPTPPQSPFPFQIHSFIHLSIPPIHSLTTTCCCNFVTVMEDSSCRNFVLLDTFSPAPGAGLADGSLEPHLLCE